MPGFTNKKSRERLSAGDPCRGRRTAELQIMRATITTELTISIPHITMDQKRACAFQSVLTVPTIDFISLITLLLALFFPYAAILLCKSF
jgi:hypothetical protein